jgi:hypothetical protein
MSAYQSILQHMSGYRGFHLRESRYSWPAIQAERYFRRQQVLGPLLLSILISHQSLSRMRIEPIHTISLHHTQREQVIADKVCDAELRILLSSIFTQDYNPA